MNKILIGLVVIILGALAGWYAFGGKASLPKLALPSSQKTSPTPVPTSEPSGLYTTYTQESVTPGPQATGAASKGGTPVEQSNAKGTVRFTDQGFVPSVLTVKLNTAVTFINDSASSMWVASDVHPTHQLLPGFDQLKSVGRGGTYTYTFVNIGTWKYHNHVAPTITGIVVVTH